MEILVLQRARVEHPGVFRDFLREDGHEYVPVELDEGERSPPSTAPTRFGFWAGQWMFDRRTGTPGWPRRKR